MKRSQRTNQRSPANPRAGYMIVGGLLLLAVLAVGGWYLWNGSLTSTTRHEHSEAAQAIEHRHGEAVELPDIHGIGYSANGERLVVAAHAGLRVFVGGEWLIPEVPVNDYMGYSATDTGFYSSGHPGPGSSLPNPLGLVKSTDAGKTLTTLGFSQESDFHLIGAGYKSHALYVFTPAPNSRLTPGLHHSLDEGQSWAASTVQGLTAQPLQLAVHPTEASTIALATESGLFLSADYGNQLQRVGEIEPVSAASFAPTGEQLFFGYQTLRVYDTATGTVTALHTPPIAAPDGTPTSL
ncbi:MAG: glycosyl hydrolase [Ardenticatenales bacterium]|nr:glycosyl hydrolase [Ardenticatenales bacterium]